ncbi:hypothetical protein INR49_005610 [Caranx melampygus]|nr:hypothetical protein INR49_005610 [Caranx melampygus]
MEAWKDNLLLQAVVGILLPEEGSHQLGRGSHLPGEGSPCCWRVTTSLGWVASCCWRVASCLGWVAPCCWRVASRLGWVAPAAVSDATGRSCSKLQTGIQALALHASTAPSLRDCCPVIGVLQGSPG